VRTAEIVAVGVFWQPAEPRAFVLEHAEPTFYLAAGLRPFDACENAVNSPSVQYLSESVGTLSGVVPELHAVVGHELVRNAVPSNGTAADEQGVFSGLFLELHCVHKVTRVIVKQANSHEPSSKREKSACHKWFGNGRSNSLPFARHFEQVVMERKA